MAFCSTERPYDNRFMALAIRQAMYGLGQTGSNPSVGAVVVQEKQSPVIISYARTHDKGRPHAETQALEQAGAQADGATLYVTLEPCSHYGQTPPCVDAIIKSGIRRVVIGADDPNPDVAGRGISRLQEAGIDVVYASKKLKQRAEWVTKGHINRMRLDRPFVQVKLAVDHRGNIAPGQDQTPVWVTGELARKQGHKMRAQADVIVTGHGTAQTDHPRLTCRLPGLSHRSPIRIVLDSMLRLSSDNPLFQNSDKVPLWLACANSVAIDRQEALKEAGAKLLKLSQYSAKDGLSIKELLQALGMRGITRVMVEAGPKVVRSFWDAKCIDEIVVFKNPTCILMNGISAVHDMTLDDILDDDLVKRAAEHRIGTDIMSTYYITKNEV